MRRRSHSPWAILGLALAAAAAQAPAQPAPPPAAPLVVEGFEKIEHVRSWPDKLEAVAEGDGVTEGRQAARLPGGQNVLVKLRGEDCRQYGWLKLDVLTLQPLSHPLRLRATGTDLYHEEYAVAQAGKDTVAVPLSLFFPKSAPDEVELNLTNLSDRAVIMDNVRLERAAPLPPGCLAIDLGYDGQPAWCGFTHAGADCPQVVWSGKVPIGVYGVPLPDLLTGGFAGPAVGTKTVDSFDLVAPERNCTAWLWITHYADGHVQPPEFTLGFGGKVVAQRRISHDQLLAPEGLMEGLGGEWTPKWFDSVYAGRFAELVKLQLTDVRTSIAVRNCQLAALTLAPPAARAAMTAYVAQVQADQVRYRRQFVVGMKNDPRCELNPTEAESKAGMILLCPPPEEAYLSTWKPRESDRAEKVSLVAANGLLAAVTVAVSPLKRTSALAASVGPLRSADGRNLSCAKDSPDVMFCKTVPRALQGRADQQPWLLTRKNPPLSEKQIAWMVFKITPAADAKPGLYEGSIRVNLGAAAATISLEVKVVQTGPEGKDVPTLGLLHSGNPASFYTSLVTDDLPEASRDGLQQKIAQQLLESSNALCLPGVFVQGNLATLDAELARNLRNYPAKIAKGFALFDAHPAMETLRSLNVAPGSRQYEQVAIQIVARSAALAAGAGVRDFHIVAGTNFDPERLPDRIRMAAAIQAAGGSSALFAEDAYLLRAPKEQVQSLFTSAGAVIFTNYRKDLPAWIQAYRKVRPTGRVYVYGDRPDQLTGGLFAAALGADGAYYGGAHMQGGAYNGFFLDGAGVLALESDGTLAATAASIWLQQAQADFLLVRRAEALAAGAAGAKAAAGELTKTLADLKAAMAARAGTYYDAVALRSAGTTRTEVEAWRARLVEACGKAWDAMHPQ